jgi:hypothetical protein
MPPKKGKARMKKRKNLGESTTKVNNKVKFDPLSSLLS